MSTFNKKEWHNLEDLMKENLTNPLTIPKDILETNQVEYDTDLTERTCSRSIPRQTLLSSPVVSQNKWENDKTPNL